MDIDMVGRRKLKLTGKNMTAAAARVPIAGHHARRRRPTRATPAAP